MSIAYVNEQDIDDEDNFEEIELTHEASAALEVLSQFCIFGNHGIDPEHMARHVRDYGFAKTMNDLEGNGEMEH